MTRSRRFAKRKRRAPARAAIRVAVTRAVAPTQAAAILVEATRQVASVSESGGLESAGRWAVEQAGAAAARGIKAEA